MPRKFPPLKAASAAFAGLLVLSGGLAASGALPGPFAPISATGSDQTGDVTTTSSQPPTAPVAQTSVQTGVDDSSVEIDDHESDQPEVSDTDPADNGKDQTAVDDNDQGDVSTPPAATPAPSTVDDGNDQGDDNNDQGDVSTPPAQTPAPAPPTVDDGNDQGGNDPGPGSVHPDNHGAAVSTIAHQHDETDGNHGAAVSAVAHQNAGHDDGDNDDEGSVSAPPAPAPPTVSNGDDQGEDNQGGTDVQGGQDGQHPGSGHDQQKVEDN